jgi:hydrogenase-4 component B
VSTPFLVSLPVLLAGAVVALWARSNRLGAAAAITSQAVATLFVLIGVAPLLGGGDPLVVTWSWPRPIETIVFRVDALGAFFLVWALPMTLVGTVYAVGYLRPYYATGRHGGPHFALLNMISVSFVLIYSVQNALVFLLGWELAAVAAWLLVIWDYRKQKIRFAGFNYLVSTHVGLFVLVAAFMLLHSKTSSMDFAAFASYLSQPSQARDTIFLLLGIAFALKAAFFPFHTWLPRAHAAAPAHVSALMSGVIHKAGLFAFLRFTLLMGRPDEWMGWSVLGFGLLSAFFGVLYTAAQRDLKRLLGYSSTEHVGIAAMGFGLGYLGWAWGNPVLTACGFAGGLFHILNHAFFKCLLFYGAGAIQRATHTVDLERLGGVARRMPRTAVAFFVGILALAALPPLNGFASELVVYAGLLAGSAPTPSGNVALVTVAAALAFVGAVGALSVTRAFGIAFLGQPRDRHVHAHIDGDPPGSMLAPMVTLMIAAVVLGVVPELGLELVAAVVALVPGAADPRVALEPLAPVVWAGRVLAVLVLLIAVVRWRQGVRARRSVTWGCGYTAATPRMQYTGSGFAEHFARIFEGFLPALRREKVSSELFPPGPGSISSHHPDVVERRIFEVLGHGEDFVAEVSKRVPEEPGFAFAAGLIAVVVIGALVFGVGSP